MSVYEEKEAGYLTYTKNLNLSCEPHASRREDKVMSPKQRSLATYT
jgi:hypothetical protein